MQRATGTIVLAGQRSAASDPPGTPITATLSTEQIARDGGVIWSDSWRWDEFSKNNILGVNHDFSKLPIGRVDNLRVEDRSLKGDLILDPLDSTGREVESKIRRGFLHSLSVSFDVKSYSPPERTPPGARWASDLTSLLEVSVVSVPSDTGTGFFRSAQAGIKQHDSERSRHVYELARKLAPDAGPIVWARITARVLAGIDDALAARRYELNRLAIKADLLALMSRLSKRPAPARNWR